MMARLTKQVKDGYFVLNCDACEMKDENCTPMGCLQVATKRLADYEETLLEPKEVAGLCAMDKRSHMAKMLRWEEAEQDGRLVVLPCKVGDTVFRVFTVGTREPLIKEVVIKTAGEAADLIGRIGKKNMLVSVFRTREEAEAALKETRNSGEQERQI